MCPPGILIILHDFKYTPVSPSAIYILSNYVGTYNFINLTYMIYDIKHKNTSIEFYSLIYMLYNSNTRKDNVSSYV